MNYRDSAAALLVAASVMVGDHPVSTVALLGLLQENSEIFEAHGLFASVRKWVVPNANQTPIHSDIHLADYDGGGFIFAPK